MKKNNIESWGRICLIAVLIISLIPLLWIAFYNHSCADDFSYGAMTRHAWIETHNIIEVFKAMLERVKESYLTWQGTYSAIGLFALQPAVWGEQYYFLSTYILLAFFLLGNFLFFRALIGIVYKNKNVADILSCTVSILSIQLLPSPVQGFFWWNGSSFYVVFHSIMLIQVALFIKIFHSGSGNLKQYLVGMFLGVFLAGGNYISALLTAELTFLFFMACLFYKKNLIKGMGSIAAVTMIGFLINVTAPGNAVRQSNFTSMPPLKAILYSFHEAYNYMSTWTSPFLIIALVFLFPFIFRLYKDLEIKKIKIPLSIILGVLFSLFASSFTPTLYAYGSAGPGRVQNIRFFLWILLIIITEIVVVHYIIVLLKKAFGDSNFNNIFEIIAYKQILTFGITIAFCVCFFASNFILVGNKNFLTSVSAARSLYNGEAKEYDNIANQRRMLLESDLNEVELNAYSTKPYVLFFDDIQLDENDWRNKAVANFYQKEKVYLK